LEDQQLKLITLEKITELGEEFIAKTIKSIEDNGYLKEESLDSSFRKLSSMSKEECFFLGLSIAVFSFETGSIDIANSIMDDSCSRVCLEKEYKGILN
tara:strand:- start:3220 stop:3513 length:294 start_codon:yes stop_codon:yes gene_type:complete